MRKRKRPQEGEAGGNFDLLFLQLMMIMMAFFILLTTMAVIVDRKRLEALNSIAGAFSVLPAGITLSQEKGSASPGQHLGQQSAAKRTAKELTEVAKLLGMGDAVHILPLDADTVRVRLPEHILFRPGSTTLAADFYPLLDALADVFARPEITEITIAGHTDEKPVRGLPYASNWELSAVRAMQVFRALAERGVPKERMVAAGMGSAHPLPDEHARGDGSLNRRVDFYLRFRPVTAKAQQVLDVSPFQRQPRSALAKPGGD